MTISKKSVLQMVKKLPSKIDLDDLIYELYVKKMIALGEADIRAGRVLPHEKVMREVASWFV